MGRITSAVAILALAAGLSGCPFLVEGGTGEDTGVDPGASMQCTPGTRVECFCPDGTVSQRWCETPACECPMPNAGASGGVAGMQSTGAGGAAGMATSAGTGGMTAAGAGGAGGVGGAAGASGTGGTGGAGGAGGAAGNDEPPAGEYCAATADWDPAWTAFEDRVLELTNEARAAGADCGTYGVMPAAAPLTMNANLRCSARLHSKDMGEKGYFAHDAQDGRDPFERMSDAGYSGGTMGENIAKGQQTPEEVVAGWIDSDGHCANIMNGDFTEIGVGFYQGQAANQWFNENMLWTQNFGGGGGGGGSCPWGPPWC